MIIYTSITGGYEQPRNDILVLSNDPFKDSRRSARMHKCLPPKSDYSLWIDGNTSLKVSPESLKKFLKTDIAVFKHPLRDCIYQEAEACRSLDDPSIIQEQMSRYRAEGYPEHNGLAATTYVLRRHTPKMEAFNNLWWSEICRGSKRDQLSFNYAAWKLKVEVSYFYKEVWEDNFKHNELFNYKKHNEI